jgi:hypothetical protein
MMHSKYFSSLITGMMAVAESATDSLPKQRDRTPKVKHVARTLYAVGNKKPWTASPQRQLQRGLVASAGKRQVKRMRYLDRHEDYAQRHPVMAKQLGRGA